MASDDPITTPPPAGSTLSGVPEGGALAEYEVELPDGSLTTLQLTEADAEARGAKAAQPAATDTEAKSKATTPENKARRAPNK